MAHERDEARRRLYRAAAAYSKVTKEITSYAVAMQACDELETAAIAFAGVARAERARTSRCASGGEFL